MAAVSEKERLRLHYLRNREQMIARAKAWKLANPERARELDHASYLRNRERHLKRCREWEKAHPERIRELNREAMRRRRAAGVPDWRVANRERSNELARLAAQRPERKRKNADRQLARNARKLAQFVEDVDRSVLLERDEGICGICLTPVDPADFHVDHIIPLARGGEHSYANTQIAHPLCNIVKGAN